MLLTIGKYVHVTKIIYLVAFAYTIHHPHTCQFCKLKLCWVLLNQDCTEKWQLHLADLYSRGDDCGEKETVVIELQGDLQSRVEGGSFDGKFIGNLVFTSDVSFFIKFSRGSSILVHFTALKFKFLQGCVWNFSIIKSLSTQKSSITEILPKLCNPRPRNFS